MGNVSHSLFSEGYWDSILRVSKARTHVKWVVKEGQLPRSVNFGLSFSSSAKSLGHKPFCATTRSFVRAQPPNTLWSTEVRTLHIVGSIQLLNFRCLSKGEGSGAFEPKATSAEKKAGKWLLLRGKCSGWKTVFLVLSFTVNICACDS